MSSRIFTIGTATFPMEHRPPQWCNPTTLFVTADITGDPDDPPSCSDVRSSFPGISCQLHIVDSLPGGCQRLLSPYPGHQRVGECRSLHQYGGDDRPVPEI
eukprot:scaffold8252_cov92-Cylindrotheca_fusiformis.AAC.2